MIGLAVVLKRVRAVTGISNKAMAVLNSFVNQIFECIAYEASSTSLLSPNLAVYSKKINHLITR